MTTDTAQVPVSRESLSTLLSLFPDPIRSDRLGDYRPEIAQAVQALRNALTQPTPTIPGSALSGMASIPDKPEPGREALVGLARSWEEEAILLYAQEARVRDGSVIWRDQECKTEHDTLRRCAAELLARHKVPQAPAEEAKP